MCAASGARLLNERSCSRSSLPRLGPAEGVHDCAQLQRDHCQGARWRETARATGRPHVPSVRSNLNARPGPERRIARWEHEDLLGAVQQRLDAKPASYATAARDGRASVRHDEGGHGGDALPHQDSDEGAAEMALSVLAYNQTRVMTIVSFKPLIPAIRAHNISPPQHPVAWTPASALSHGQEANRSLRERQRKANAFRRGYLFRARFAVYPCRSLALRKRRGKTRRRLPL